MKEFKGTKEKVYALQYGGTFLIHDEDFYESNNILDIDDVGEEKVNANKDLIIDAFKVRQQINCDLSELKEQRDEMLGMLERVIDLKTLIEYGDVMVNEQNISEASALSNMISEIEQLIKKVKNEN